jgi:uncharacterized protein YndB with AHSA1/START domain
VIERRVIKTETAIDRVPVSTRGNVGSLHDVDEKLFAALEPGTTPTCYGCEVSSTHTRYRIEAPRASVYRALLDADAVARWRVPTGMTSHVHAFEPREGGKFRISLTYAEPTGTGKTTAHTDTYHGRFVKLVPNEQVVEVVEFETADPALQGEMTISYTLADADGGTEVIAVHDSLPPGVSTTDNETGWRMSLANLAALVEADEHPRD